MKYDFFSEKNKNGKIKQTVPTHKERLELTLQGLLKLQQYPPQEFYRVFVDGLLLKKEHGWIAYEKREPGCLGAVFRAFAFGLQHICDEDFTVQLIEGIHKRCGALEDGSLINKYRKWINLGQIRNTPELDPFFGILKERASIDGITELLDIIEGDTYLLRSIKLIGNYSTLINPLTLNIRRKKYVKTPGIDFSNRMVATSIYNGLLTRDEHQEYVATHSDALSARHLNYCAPLIGGCDMHINYYTKKLLHDYNNARKNATNNDKKCLEIAWYTKLLQLLHPFEDANGRVLVNVLLNMALIQQGEDIATFEEPNIFDVFSRDEIFEKIREAQQNTQKIVAGEQLFEFDTHSMSPEAKNEHGRLVQPVFEALAQTIEMIRHKLADLESALPAQTDFKHDENDHGNLEANVGEDSYLLCQALKQSNLWSRLFPATTPESDNREKLFKFLQKFPPALESIKDNMILIKLLGSENLRKLVCQSPGSAKLVLTHPILTEALLPADEPQSHSDILKEISLSSSDVSLYILGDLKWREKLLSSDPLSSSKILIDLVKLHSSISTDICHEDLIDLLFPLGPEFYDHNHAALLKLGMDKIVTFLNIPKLKSRFFPNGEEYIERNRAHFEKILRKNPRYIVKTNIMNNLLNDEIFLPPSRAKENKQAIVSLSKSDEKAAYTIARCKTCWPYLSTEAQQEITEHYKRLPHITEYLKNLFAAIPASNQPVKQDNPVEQKIDEDGYTGLLKSTCSIC